MNERLKRARTYLGLTQEFAAEQTRLSLSEIIAVESGQRKVTVDELARFSRLYGISTDELMCGPKEEPSDAEMFTESFSDLTDIDKRGIRNLIAFKRKYKAGKTPNCSV